MMDAETKQAVGARLRRIAGQAQAVERMVEADLWPVQADSRAVTARGARS